jgi:acetyl-CoA carboxylase biotin carboxyl carrier protein
MEIDKKIILKLIQVLEDLKKSLKGINLDSKEESVVEEIEIPGTVIKSPIVGTAYLATEPGGKKFIEIGKKIKKGDTIMIVEAMKTMNHVPSSSDGIVKEISVEDGQPVEFGQKLIILE